MTLTRTHRIIALGASAVLIGGVPIALASSASASQEVQKRGSCSQGKAHYELAGPTASARSTSSGMVPTPSARTASD